MRTHGTGLAAGWQPCADSSAAWLRAPPCKRRSQKPRACRGATPPRQDPRLPRHGRISDCCRNLRLVCPSPRADESESRIFLRGFIDAENPFSRRFVLNAAATRFVHDSELLVRVVGPADGRSPSTLEPPVLARWGPRDGMPVPVCSTGFSAFRLTSRSKFVILFNKLGNHRGEASENPDPQRHSSTPILPFWLSWA